MATRELIKCAHQLIVSLLIVQSLLKFGAGGVLRFDGENDAWICVVNRRLSYRPHFAEPGRGGSRALGNAVVAFAFAVVYLPQHGLDTISRTSSKPVQDDQSSSSSGRH